MTTRYDLIPGIGLVEQQHSGELLPGGVLQQTKPVEAALAGTESGSDTAAITGKLVLSAALAATESGSDTAAITVELEGVTPEPEVPAAGGVALRDPEITPVEARPWVFDDRDLLETVPIIMGIINAARR